MSKEDGLTFGLAGVLAFAVSTAWYAAFGAGLLEKSFWFYAANAFLVGGAAVFVFHVTTRLRHTPRRKRLLAAAVFAVPSLIGGAIMLAMFKDIFPALNAVSLGRYAAFILLGDALLAGMALDGPKRAVSRAR